VIRSPASEVKLRNKAKQPLFGQRRWLEAAPAGALLAALQHGGKRSERAAETRAYGSKKGKTPLEQR
jgi:hypothetical protein